ncbi:CDP-diacylglycerol--glycerol-3-phosphate 3-phosphatidyltransferase [Ornithinimicrobium cryptoxanthini]|uniref:CDP-diacylglycerol--glycerol-3-phosphate 3-phosphatidyltransferase n=1 Tax=Ornithinimicrobium cryptoxanthini TaxID=2934161 RepID=A0ABY4YFR1_9MICO|nr:CDP-diacylglycerol--glycerol-3-phosphate 3-phosphatidyltransferase [Ornithinimicrobium cryptoxanthini]USQ75390.1 CDP-diacylglycerol--glycerol-3-phosphate 3-phosphatidyltransferase [Ornithinimicrobium cryptoxanthini]
MSTAPDPATTPSSPRAGSWNLPNALTILRILLVPVFLWLLLTRSGESDPHRWWAAVVFALASLTDWLDGELARRRSLVTNFGKVADPIADKALMGSALIGLSILDVLPWWITVVILVRELGITALRFWVIRRGIIPASKGGKLKTTLQAIGLLLLIPPLTGFLHTAGLWIMYAAVVVTVVTGVDYVLTALRLRQDPAPDRGR